MQRAVWSAASGMQAQQMQIDTIANNLANVNTTGFKRSRAEFQDLLYQTIIAPGTSSSTTTRHPAGIQIIHHDPICVDLPGQDNDRGLTQVKVCLQDLDSFLVAHFTNREPRPYSLIDSLSSPIRLGTNLIQHSFWHADGVCVSV